MAISPDSAQGGAASAPQGLVVDLEAIWREIGELAPGGDGYTMWELREAWNCGKDKAREIVRKAQAKGICRVGQKTVTSLSGRLCLAPAYIFEAKP